MEWRLQEALRRLGEADRALREHGRDPESFVLVYAGGGTRDILHAGWDESWGVPTAEDVDDLEELGYLRSEPPKNSKRIFALTVRGRDEARALDQPVSSPAGGRAPGPGTVLEWLQVAATSAPACLDEPVLLLDRAARDGLIEPSGREALAQRILDLRDDGYLVGAVPDFQQAGAEQRLQLADGLRLTVKAERFRRDQGPRGGSVNFYGQVVAGQIAAGNIANYVSFSDLLGRAEEALEDLEGVAQEDLDAAKSVLQTLRGDAADASEAVLTSAGGGLLAQVLAQLLGLS